MIFFSSERTFRRIINHWKKTGCVSNRESFTRAKNKMKITEAELETLDQLIILNKETTALQAKRELNIRATTRSVQNYLNKLGWKKIVIAFVPGS
jgi:transposase